MLVVDRITLREIRLALKEPFGSASGVVQERRIAVVELTESGGATVMSECVAFPLPFYTAETVDTAWLAIREWLAPRLLGRRLPGPEPVHAVLDENIRGHRMAKAALEMGCWALAAEAGGISLASLLGGTRDRVATGIALGTQRDPAALVASAQAAAAAGYRRIKLKIRPGQDLAHLQAVRSALGNGIDLAADGNAAYTLADADALAALDAFSLSMLEQPLGEEDLLGHAALQRRLATPICLDESITGVDRARDMVQLGSGRIVNIKPGRVGGFTVAKAIHDLCAAAGIPVWCGGMLESGIGRAYNVALASLPNFSLPGDLSPSARYWQRDVVTPEWTMDGAGMVRVPRELPGIGVTVDREYLDSLTVRIEELTTR